MKQSEMIKTPLGLVLPESYKEILTKICDLTREQSFWCAVEVDLTRRTIVFYGKPKKCVEVSHQINDYGPDYRMPRSGESMEMAVEGF
jgi:hypothetical protein